MPIRRSPNDARHPRPQGGRDHPEQVVAINRNDWSQSIGTPGRDHLVRADGAAVYGDKGYTSAEKKRTAEATGRKRCGGPTLFISFARVEAADLFN